MNVKRIWLNVIFSLILAALFLSGFLLFDLGIRSLLYAIIMFFLAVLLSYVAITKNKSAADLLYMGTDGSQIITNGISAWTHWAFYLGLASILLIPAPFAIVSGSIGLTKESHKGFKVVWRAWFGIIAGLVSLGLYTPLLLTIIKSFY